MSRAFSAPRPECAPGWKPTRKPESDCPGKQARPQGLPESSPWWEGFRVFGELVIQAPKVRKETKAEKWQPVCLVVRVILISSTYPGLLLQAFRFSRSICQRALPAGSQASPAVGPLSRPSILTAQRILHPDHTASSILTTQRVLHPVLWLSGVELRLSTFPQPKTRQHFSLHCVPIFLPPRNGSRVARIEPRSDLPGPCLHLRIVPNIPMSICTHFRLVPRQHAGVNAPQGHVWQDKVEHFGSKDLGREVKRES